jgi:hypothetical protein
MVTLIYIRILMSTIAPKLSEFAMNTYSFPCNRVNKENNVIMLMHENSGSATMGAKGISINADL